MKQQSNSFGKKPLYIMHFFGILCLSFLFMATEGNARTYSWTVKRSVEKGQTVPIQTMYNITRKGPGTNCGWDTTPPKPTMVGTAKLGSVSYKAGKTFPRPDQCTDVEIDANFADYTAGNTAGQDKFTITWRAKSGAIYTVRYRIKVE